MSQVIEIEGLGKSYVLGHNNGHAGYQLLRDKLTHQAKAFARKTFDAIRGKPLVLGDTFEEFWALRNVSFQVNRGEVLGIVGRNGAGKSTLLKILSRITDPTAGRVTLRGRVASLLEVGTGFHPELTGRENIFLNGAILGMSRAEIVRNFDAIVDFAEVARFIDTPVKRYSSGMYVRLAFAVAAHLDPEILIVDEVLAVGDIQFQRKCLGKMGELASGQHRTVLFVSHNREAVTNLCTRAIALRSGELVYDGTPTGAFLATATTDESLERFDATTSVNDKAVRRGDGRVRYDKVEIECVADPEAPRVKQIEIRLECVVQQPVPRLESAVLLKSPLGTETLIQMFHTVSEQSLDERTRHRIAFRLRTSELGLGEYPLYLWLGNGEQQPFDVVDGLLPPISVSEPADATDSVQIDVAVSTGILRSFYSTSSVRV